MQSQKFSCTKKYEISEALIDRMIDKEIKGKSTKPKEVCTVYMWVIGKNPKRYKCTIS